VTAQDWRRVHELLAADQAKARERVLCRRGIAQRVRVGIARHAGLRESSPSSHAESRSRA
jgi:hypothetical protein